MSKMSDLLEISSESEIVDMCSTTDDFVVAPCPTPAAAEVPSGEPSRDSGGGWHKHRRRVRKNTPVPVGSRGELRRQLNAAEALIKSISVLLSDVCWKFQDDEKMFRRIASHLMQIDHHRDAIYKPGV